MFRFKRMKPYLIPHSCQPPDQMQGLGVGSNFAMKQLQEPHKTSPAFDNYIPPHNMTIVHPTIPSYMYNSVNLWYKDKHTNHIILYIMYYARFFRLVQFTV